jgi:hypothetical protein
MLQHLDRSAARVAIIVALIALAWLRQRAPEHGRVPASPEGLVLAAQQREALRTLAALADPGGDPSEVRQTGAAATPVVVQPIEVDTSVGAPLGAAVDAADDRIHPVYNFWDDSGGPPMLDDELTLTLVEAADGVAREPWSASVELSAVRNMQPRYTVAMPLPTAGLYRATCRDGNYEPVDVWVPEAERPRVAIVLSCPR